MEGVAIGQLSVIAPFSSMAARQQSYYSVANVEVAWPTFYPFYHDLLVYIHGLLKNKVKDSYASSVA